MIRMTALLTLAFAMVPAGAGRTRVDFVHGHSFGPYKTYSWVQPSERRSCSDLFPNEIMWDRIRGFIEEALAVKGLRRVESGGDLLIGYCVKVTEIPTYTTFNDGGGWGWGWGWGWGSGWAGGISTTTTELVYEGALVIDITDARQNRLVFQGVSTHTISSKPAKNTKRLANAVSEIFEKYPPAR